MQEPALAVTDLSCEKIGSLIASMGEPAFRAGQLRQWLYRNLAADYAEMTNLPLAFREKLNQEMSLHRLEPVDRISANDGTVKVLFKCFDGNTLEAALMHYGGNGDKERRTVCVSTQAGCSIGCPFCATGRQGLQRNLTPGEIIDQVLYFARILRGDEKNTTRKRDNVSNIVFMGMGEPLANYHNLWQAVETLNHPDCFGIGARSMTISTAGLVPGIKRLSAEQLQVGLAVSLHAANNTLRNRLVPLNRKYPLEMLMPACREYSRATGRRLSFEYTLFHHINDSLEQARELAGLLLGFNCHVNLIPANRTDDSTFQPPSRNTVLAFENELKRNHVNVTLRESRGRAIDAGCGQLRSRYLKESSKKPEAKT